MPVSPIEDYPICLPNTESKGKALKVSPVKLVDYLPNYLHIRVLEKYCQTKLEMSSSLPN